MTPDPLPHHLQLELLRQLCSDTNAGAEAVLHQARRAVRYGATVEQVRLIAGHWPGEAELG